MAVFDDIRTQGYLLDTFVANAANLGLNMDDTLAIDLKDYRQVIETNMVWNFAMARQAAQQNSLTARTPLGDVAEFEDIAEAAWYLGSDASRNTTGAELSVDGGNLVQLTPRT